MNLPRGVRVGLQVLAGTLCALALLEGALRVTGALGRQAARARLRAASARQSHCLIACIGDSFTRGLGVPVGADFPSRLEELLVRDGMTNVAVANLGIDDQNSAQLLRRLPGLLAALRPRVVVLQIGSANYWNTGGKPGASARAAPWEALRLWRFARLVAGDVQARRAAAAAARQPAGPLDARACFATGAWQYAQVRDLESATSWFARGMQADARLAANYAGMLTALNELGAYAAALACAAAAASNHVRCAALAREASAAASALGFADAVTGLVALLDAPGMPTAYPALAKRFDFDQDADAVAAWIAQDVRAIIALCRTRGVAVLVHDYPVHYAPSMWTRDKPRVNAILARVAAEAGVPFVSHQAAFAALGEQRWQYFQIPSAGNHCSAAGYALMTRTLAAALAPLVAEAP
jgi:lysophospholipase L1-like esterase